MRVFVDTSAFYALLDRDDDNHARARSAWTGIVENGTVAVTSSYVLVETVALLQSRLGLEAVRAFEEAMVPVLHVEYVTGELHKLGMAALLVAARRRLSLVDCVSFEIMRR
ncbi:MAG: PIN domain-containing protein, partial [Syntrophales bacterium]|nr:PIN domain-containing protein [Syntrophales bacterium]